MFVNPTCLNKDENRIKTTSSFFKRVPTLSELPSTSEPLYTSETILGRGLVTLLSVKCPVLSCYSFDLYQSVSGILYVQLVELIVVPY